MDYNEYYVRIPLQAFTDSRLTRAAVCVYAVLISAADQYGMCDGLTVDDIAARSCLNERTVRRAERQLCEAGYIKVEPTGRSSVIWVRHDLRPLDYDVFAAAEAAAFREQLEAAAKKGEVS